MRTIPLAEATVFEEVGGKAANLARLMAAGAPVPDGFAIPNTTLQHFIAEQEAVLRRQEHAVPADLAVIDAWHRLDASPVIVRSSAAGEDSADASFAGQLDTIAGVTTASGLRAAVQQVWNSQWSERVLAYQSTRHTFLAGMGVVVQRQVDAAVSGVLFTRSPGGADGMLLEYCPGLGEALVSGAINPGRISVSRHGLAWQELATLDEGIDAAAPARQLLLENGRLALLGRIALSIETAFGAPQDIEWTIDRDGNVWIVQSRPITAGVTRPPADASAVHWSNANVNENFPQPISPLLYSVARAGYYHYFRNLGVAFGVSERRLAVMEPALRQIIGVHGARMYYNLSSIHQVLRSAPFGDLLTASFDQFVGAEQGTQVPQSTSRVYQALEVARIAAKTTWQYLFLTSRVETFERTVDDFAAATHPDHLEAKPGLDLLADLREFMAIRCHRWKNASLADAGSMVCYGLLQRLLARAFPAEDQQALHNTLLKALPDLVSGMPPLKLWELSRMIRATPGLHALVQDASPADALAAIRSNPQFASFNQALHVFLEDWGFRCSSELMLTVPSFQEDPVPVIDLLRTYATMSGESPARLLERQSAERVAETARVVSALRRRPVSRWLPFIPQSLVVGTVLKWTQRSIQLRERARLKQALLYSRLRRIALALGDRLTRDQRLSQRDDIFFLTVDEIDLLVSGGEMFPDDVDAVVEVRRQAHRRLGASTPPDSMHLAAGEYLRTAAPSEVQPAAAAGSRQLTGVGACGGSRTAPAAILRDVTESGRLKAGDILVTRQTDPGWGPVFPLISGLVIERGGMLSHGAIIAREFGIPSVVGVKDATRLIQHGSAITVDGDRGLVRLPAEAL